jgi:tRNA G37 N-methylase Trm5
MNEETEKELSVFERLKANIERAKGSADRIMNKALEDRALIEEMDMELQDIADELENKETELLGGEKVDETENAEVEMRMDVDPNSPTYNTMIPA